MKIKLAEITGTVKNFDELKNNIRHAVPDYIFFNHRPVIIAFHALKVFNLGKIKYQIDDAKSVEAACLKILQVGDIYQGTTIEPVFKRNENDKDYDPISHFITWIIGFYQMPFLVLRDLEVKVRKDLKRLIDLIREYELEPVIKEYIATGEKRSEHDTRIRIDFYKRCLQERDQIVDYLVNGLEARALAKASIDPENRMFRTLLADENFDKPYRWWALLNMEYFDYRKINLCRHRIEGSSREFLQMQGDYNSGDKQKFYSRLRKSMPPKQVFQGILQFYIKMIPNIEQREPIFRELFSLFQARKWYGFTALALTQVEGLFSDMVVVINHPKRVSSLPTKVNALRSLYEFEERGFDYYEYYLPRHRNRFLHYGQLPDENFKWLAYDLLYDLHYLMKIFHQLNDPHVELYQLLKKNNLDFFNSLGNFVDVFRMVKVVEERLKKKPKDRQLKNLLFEWETFERNTLSPSGFAELYLDIANTTIDERMQRFFASIASGTEYNGHLIELDKMALKDLESNKEKIIKAVKDLPFINFDDYGFLVECSVFIQDYKKYLKHAGENVTSQAEIIRNRHHKNFRKLNVINPALFPK